MIIDCESPDLWEKYLEARYRSRASRIRVGDDGYEYLEIDGRRATLPRPGQLGTLGGNQPGCRWLKRVSILFTSGARSRRRTPPAPPSHRALRSAMLSRVQPSGYLSAGRPEDSNAA